MSDKKIKIGEDDKVELYQEYIKAMLKLGYAPFAIGAELAYISHALEIGE